MKRIGNSKEPTLEQVKKILSNLRKKYPGKAFQITIQAWHHSTDVKSVKYQIGILPGFDETPCQHIDRDTWSELLKEYRVLVRKMQ